MQEQYTNRCGTSAQSPYTALHPVLSRVPPLTSANAFTSAMRAGHGRAVPRVTGVRACRSQTKGRPTSCVASLVTPLLGHLSSCIYPCDPANAVHSARIEVRLNGNTTPQGQLEHARARVKGPISRKILARERCLCSLNIHCRPQQAWYARRGAEPLKRFKKP